MKKKGLGCLGIGLLFLCGLTIVVMVLDELGIIDTEASEAMRVARLTAEYVSPTPSHTPTETSIPTATPIPTNTPLVTNTPHPSPTPIATSTTPPTSTAAPSPTAQPTDAPAQTYYVMAAANLRSCPRVADECQVVQQAGAGAALQVVGQVDGSIVSESPVWYEVDQNGQRMYVHSSLVSQQPPQAQPAQPAQPGQPAQSQQGSGGWAGCVDINTASFEDLQRIYGIGPDRAQQIINLRSISPFSSVDALTRVDGIAAGTLRRIKEENIACVP